MSPQRLWLAVLVALCGCARPTELMLAIHTDVDLDELILEAKRADELSVVTIWKRPTLPATIGLLPRGAVDGRSVDVRLRARREGADIVTRRALVPFARGRVMLLRLSLLASCTGVSCPETQTCDAGRCIDAYVDPTGLPEFTWDAALARADAGARADGPTVVCLAPQTLSGNGVKLPIVSDNGDVHAVQVEDKALTLHSLSTSGWGVRCEPVALAETPSTSPRSLAATFVRAGVVEFAALQFRQALVGKDAGRLVLASVSHCGLKDLCGSAAADCGASMCAWTGSACGQESLGAHAIVGGRRSEELLSVNVHAKAQWARWVEQTLTTEALPLSGICAGSSAHAAVNGTRHIVASVCTDGSIQARWPGAAFTLDPPSPGLQRAVTVAAPDDGLGVIVAEITATRIMVRGFSGPKAEPWLPSNNITNVSPSMIALSAATLGTSVYVFFGTDKAQYLLDAQRGVLASHLVAPTEATFIEVRRGPGDKPVFHLFHRAAGSGERGVLTYRRCNLN